MTELIDNELVGEVVDAYLDWREVCDAVWEASDRWAHAPATDAPKAISAYLSALDREEHAANVYADAIARITAASENDREALSAAEPVTFWRARWKR
jgi:hypothetical protein